VGKKGDFFVLTANPLDKIRNSREIYQIYQDGHALDRASMLTNATMDVPKITQEDRANEAKAAAAAAQKAADDKLPHYGKFPAGPSAMSRGLAIPTPKYSKFTIKSGSPVVITVNHSATGAELREFYTAALAKYGWAASGSCWEKKNPISNKPNSLCVEPRNNQIVINISEK
jgi:hypothetical protein